MSLSIGPAGAAQSVPEKIIHPIRKPPIPIHLLFKDPFICILEPSSKRQCSQKNQVLSLLILSMQWSPAAKKGRGSLPTTPASTGECREKAPDATRREKELPILLRANLE